MRATLLLLLLAGCDSLLVGGEPAGEVDDTEAAAPVDDGTPDDGGATGPKRPRDREPPPDTAPPHTDPPVEDPPVDTGPILPPVADAGADRNVAPLVWVTLNGSGSYDPGGLTPLTYRWTIVDRPVGSTALLLGKTKQKPTFFVDVAGHYRARLEVRNRAGVWDPTPDTMDIEAVPKDDFYVQLTWSAASDLDLHVLREGASLFDAPGDCSYCNKNPSWKAAGRLDDPSLDWDVIDGYGPETTTIEQPAGGTYRVWVHYYGVGGNHSCGGSCPRSDATLDFYVNGVLVDSMTRTLRQDGEVWEAAEFTWPWGLTKTDQLSTTSATGCR